MTKKLNPKIVVIGGGTGSFTLLSGLKNHSTNITALVNMVDDGGSTGLLRDELGVLPPGDVRQCLVALSESPQELRDLFNFRFPEPSGLAGHSFGNLFLSAVEMMTKDFAEGIRLAGTLLKINGRVIPITLAKTKLHLSGSDGEVVGQHNIAEMPLMPSEKPKLWLVPKAKINPEAQKAIESADLIVIAPGDLYGSLLPALLVDGVGQAVKSARAKVVYVCNLVNKPHQTNNFDVLDYVLELERFLDVNTIDVVLYNTDLPDDSLLAIYANDNEHPVAINPSKFAGHQARYRGANLLSHDKYIQNPNDTLLKRSLVRHDADKVAKELLELLK